MTYWDRSLRKALAQFYAEPQRSVDHQRAVDWLNGLQAYLESAPREVSDAASIGGLEDALSDLTDGVNGHYRKEHSV
jgi:hypothetical protein